LHPRPDQGNQLADDEETEVPMIERTKTGRKSHGVVRLVVVM
jgi:hypothetical protein